MYNFKADPKRNESTATARLNTTVRKGYLLPLHLEGRGLPAETRHSSGYDQHLYCGHRSTCIVEVWREYNFSLCYKCRPTLYTSLRSCTHTQWSRVLTRIHRQLVIHDHTPHHNTVSTTCCSLIRQECMTSFSIAEGGGRACNFLIWPWRKQNLPHVL